jgi:hypothetical protein
MEYINTLIATDSVETQPDDIKNKEDLITKGVDFSSTKPSFVIDVPNGGAIIRDIVVFSSNIDEIEVVFTTESSLESSPIRGAPTSLPTKEFPTEKVIEIVIKVKKTTDGNSPKDVTLSVIACAEGLTSTTRAGKRLQIISWTEYSNMCSLHRYYLRNWSAIDNRLIWHFRGIHGYSRNAVGLSRIITRKHCSHLDC